MFKLETLISLIVDFIRTLLIEEVSDRVRSFRPRRRLRGMKDVHRHVHHETRQRLFNRLSTETRR